MVALLAASVGVALTDKVATAVFDDTQPLAAVPVTEYVVVIAGDTVKVPPVIV